MKALLLLGLLLATLCPVTVSAASATTATVRKYDPESRARMRRHLHHQAKVRLRQNRHR